MMTSMSRSVISLLLLASFGRRDVGVEGLAIKQTFYVDDTCEVEMSRTLLFGAIGADEAGNIVMGECLGGIFCNSWSVERSDDTPTMSRVAP